MSRYELYLLLHVVGAIVWLGGGAVIAVLLHRAMRDQPKAAEHLLPEIEALGNRLFIPASMVVLVAGILMVADGPWEFDQLWIVLGLAGFATTLGMGVIVFKPTTERLKAVMERDGGMTPAVAAETRRLLVVSDADDVILFLIVVNMVIKPTGDDVAVLAVMAAVLIAALASVAVRMRLLASAGAGPRTAQEPPLATG